MTTTNPDDVRAGLREAGARRARAERDRAEAMHDLAEWIQRGKRAGIPVTELADLAGVSRPTIYAVLGG